MSMRLLCQNLEEIDLVLSLTDSDNGSSDGDDGEAGESLGDLGGTHVFHTHLHVGLEHVVQHLRMEAE